MIEERSDIGSREFVCMMTKKKRSKITKSELDDIKGVGNILKHRLLKRFKNIEKIRSANINDLMTVDGINEKISININPTCILFLLFKNYRIQIIFL